MQERRYRLVQPSESYGDVVTELQARSEPGVIVVVLDFDHGWNVEEAARWIRSFRLEYQQRLPVYTGQKDYWRPDRKEPFRPVPMVRVFKESITPGERAELVGAGAGVYDRSSPTNKDCQTPEQMLERFAALGTNEASASSAKQSEAQQTPGTQEPRPRPKYGRDPKSTNGPQR
jgi:hypothetical protein